MYSDDEIFIKPEPPKIKSTHQRWYQKWWGVVILLLLFVVSITVAAGGIYVFKLVSLLRSGQLTPQELFVASPSDSQLSLATSLVTSDDPSHGPKDSKVVVVEFLDFQCSYCLEAEPVIRQILKDYGDKILFQYRDFPITDIHPQALMAAEAAECAHEQGKFWEMRDKIFEDQANINEAVLKTYAVQIGLNSVQFGNCLATEKYRSEIEQDLTDGYAAGVKATPTFFINGARLDGAVPLNTFEKIITAALSR
ncbi:MAG: thioredoxin domain-containing protein [Patescibacteria group bacterium]|nr:thioredoxin domain-containing protein [Patescibacteria group bacterium]